MNRTALILIVTVLCLGLAGCGTVLPPEKAADGSDWNSEWVTVGNVIGVDTPEGMTPRENNDALAANGMYYATWSIGEGEPYTNEDGEEATLYGAHVYLLLGGYKSEEEAQAALDQWQELARQNYQIEATTSESHNGQDFTVTACSFDSETNPYTRGVSAYGVYRNFALNVELTCRKDFDGDPSELLGDFLENCHYALP